MYQISNGAALLRSSRRLGSREGTQTRVSRTVVLLGLTSLFTDISSEMVVAVLPLYLVAVGGFSPLAFGVIDGLYNGATALVGLAAGYLGDRRRRHKEVAVVGYGLSAACKLVLAVVGTAVSAIGATILIDRAGKGIRTAPRDAMISLATPRDQLGAAFGVHRALDTTGALIGPILAFSVLALAPLAFESLFLVSFCFALLGVGILVLLVDGRRTSPGAVAAPRPPSLRGAAALLKIARYRALLVAAGVLGLATVSDAFVFLALQEKLDLGASLFPLLFVGSAGTFMLLSVPIGVLADRIGRARVLLGGYVALGGATPSSWRRWAAGRCSRCRSGCSAPTTPPRTGRWPRWAARSCPRTCAAAASRCCDHDQRRPPDRLGGVRCALGGVEHRGGDRLLRRRAGRGGSARRNWPLFASRD